MSVTLTSSTLLSRVIKAQSPSVIICHGFFMPRLLEELYNEGRRHLEHTIIVVGETSKGVMASIASNLKVFWFEEVEREGMKREKVLSRVPSEFVLLNHLPSTYRGEKILMTCFRFRILRLELGRLRRSI